MYQVPGQKSSNFSSCHRSPITEPLADSAPLTLGRPPSAGSTNAHRGRPRRQGFPVERLEKQQHLRFDPPHHGRCVRRREIANAMRGKRIESRRNWASRKVPSQPCAQRPGSPWTRS
jgi:hypothetical protein